MPNDYTTATVTVREALRLIPRMKEARLCWDGIVHRIDINDPLMLEAFGDYLVQEIVPCGNGEFEFNLAMRPIKAEK